MIVNILAVIGVIHLAFDVIMFIGFAYLYYRDKEESRK